MDKIDILKKRYPANNFSEPELPVLVKDTKEPLLQAIFAEDPLTGKPSSDLGLVFSSNTSADVREYIRQQMQTVRGKINLAPDAETAELTVKRNYESVTEYGDRIREFVANLNSE